VRLSRTTLSLGRIWDDNPLVLVPRAVALRLCREESRQEVSPGEALRHLDALDHLADLRIRAFVADAQLTQMPLCNVGSHDLMMLVRQAIQDRRLIALKKGDGLAQAKDDTFEQRKLVKAIEAQTRGRLSYAGRHFKLVADVDLRTLPDRERFEVVRLDEARGVLDGLAKQASTPSELAQLLRHARDKLTADWRPPFSEPDGLVLLRRVQTVAAASGSDEPAITPLQMKALMEEASRTWVGIRLVEENGEPVPDTKYKLTLSDASVRNGVLDDEGYARVDGIVAGACRVGFPDLDSDSWKEPGGGEPPSTSDSNRVAVVSTGADHTFVLVYPDYDFASDVEEDDELDFETGAESDEEAVSDDKVAAEGAPAESPESPSDTANHDDEDFDLDFEQEVEEDLELEFDSDVDESAA
jgi:hypothetical protein